MGIRPEHMSLASTSTSALSVAKGTIRHIEILGSYSLLHVDTSGNNKLIVVKLLGKTSEKRYSTVHISFERHHVHLFDKSGNTITSEKLGENPNH